MSDPEKLHEDNDRTDPERVQDASPGQARRPDGMPPEAGASPELPLSSPD